ncbi:nucleotide disphospho-sugar-binding domain-containing protein [Streptomyces sp. CS014]|uniref:nucleotide disphospho-sugar-binding domain-containing protein n=1 Tax=Streptomyces sp. CS014 TaxID=2162707 RepID=UPI000D521F7B|nr:nucleotide disphospho-sugar-binding domain-containing protein [Streptomyces sp. CS014]PVD02180.1 glycosyl transferase [Streptomyces sp. CS014]
MRVLLVAPPSDARLHSLVPLGWALRTTGHEVQIAGRAARTEAITLTGFVAVPVGAGEDGPALDAASDVAGLVAYASFWRPELIIWDTMAPAGAEAARAVGAASVRLKGPHDRRTGPDGGPGGAAECHATLDCLPPSLREPDGTDPLGVRHIPYDGSAVLPPWLNRKPRRRRVHLTAGVPDAALAGVFGAAGGVDVEMVCELAEGRIPAGTVLPAHVRLFDSVPLHTLLSSCTAVVHGGGTPDVMAALVQGLPQLTIGDPGGTGPAARIAERGAGLLVAPGEVTAAMLERLAGDPDLAKRATELREEITAMPSPREIVPELVTIAAHR